IYILFFFSSRRRHTRSTRDWSSDVCSSDLNVSATEIRMLHGERHNLHVEPIRPESRNGQADAVDGNRTLGDEERRELRGKADGQPVKVQIDAQLLDVPDGIHVSLDEVTAEPAVGAQRPLQVHVAAARQAPERGDANGLRSDVRVKLLTSRKAHGRTH